MAKMVHQRIEIEYVLREVYRGYFRYASGPITASTHTRTHTYYNSQILA